MSKQTLTNGESNDRNVAIFWPIIFAPVKSIRKSEKIDGWNEARATALKTGRKARGLSQEKLAKITGIDRQRISWIEYPKNPQAPSKDELAAILRALGLVNPQI